jgi:hypothetical protein
VNPQNRGERKKPDDRGMSEKAVDAILDQSAPSEKALLDTRKSPNQFIRNEEPFVASPLSPRSPLNRQKMSARYSIETIHSIA